MPALNILAGKAFIRIFTSHYHIFVFSVFPQFVSLSIQTVGGTDTQVVINHDLARSYLQALRSLAEDLQIKNDITVSQMARFSDIFSVIRVEENPCAPDPRTPL